MTSDTFATGAPVPLAIDRPETRLATRLAFFVAGFGIAVWAPLVPFAKERLGVDDGVLGLLLLCIGVGSLIAMVATGIVSARYGAKPVILFGGFGMALVLPLLTVAATPLAMGAALLAFGAVLGSIDVAMNVHAVEVERGSTDTLLSGFHAFFSIGGFAGAAFMTVLLSAGLGALASTILAALVMAAATLVAWPRLLPTTKAEGGPLFVLPRGFVLLLAGLTAITFLIEGAILDWGALLATTTGMLAPAQGGVGYMLFAIAMTIGRLTGDRVTAWAGDRAMLVWGGVLSVAGFAVLLVVPVGWLALSGFVLIGLGAANLVPVLFRHAGSQTAMPSGMAVAAITITGYMGILAGPAAVGFVADATSLPAAFWLLAALLALLPLSAGRVVRGEG